MKDQQHALVFYFLYSELDFLLQEKLSFPTSSVPLSPTAKQFITGLITESKYRMGFDQITSHKFLSDMDLQNIRNSK